MPLRKRTFRQRRLLPYQTAGLILLMQPVVQAMVQAFQYVANPERRHVSVLTGGTYLALFLLGLFLFAVLAHRRSERQQLPRLRTDLQPQCFCATCAKLAKVQIACEACVQEAATRSPETRFFPRQCDRCREPARSRSCMQEQGLFLVCKQCHAQEAQPSLLHATWVIGTLRLGDYRRLAASPGACELVSQEVSLVYLEPAPGEDVVLCAADLTDLPESGTLDAEHPLTALNAVWIGEDTSLLEARRALDRLDCLVGFTRAELRGISVLVEGTELDPAVAELFRSRFGPMQYQVGLEAVAACRPEAGPLPQPQRQANGAAVSEVFSRG